VGGGWVGRSKLYYKCCLVRIYLGINCLVLRVLLNYITAFVFNIFSYTFV